MNNTPYGRWASQIIGFQHEDGSWGCFHSLSQPTKAQPYTTEQALRRLYILGLTKDDEPIARALKYMRDCLAGNRHPPDRREKVLNWDAFEAHMMSTWIRRFEPDDPAALDVARMWADIVTPSFRSGIFDEAVYAYEYRKCIPELNKGERLISLPQFYMVNLLKDMLDMETESRFIDFIINNAGGIYYVYNNKIADLPVDFTAKLTTFYLSALEQLAGYRLAGDKLGYAVQWILDNRDENGEWDLGIQAKDGANFPLSDSWRKPEDRKRDCTLRIMKLLNKLGVGD